MTPGVRTMMTLVLRELAHAYRSPARVVGTVGAPLLLWVVLGAGFAGSFAITGDEDVPEVGGYSSYLLPGMVLLLVTFGSMYSSIALIQDRERGFLKAVRASGAPAWTVIVSKAFGGAAIIGVQAMLLVLLAVVLQGLSIAGALAVLTGAVAASVGVTAMGLLLAVRTKSVAGFHGLINLVLAPGWVLSGALFPVDGAAGWMAVVMRCNPLHWAHVSMSSSAFVVWLSMLMVTAVWASLMVWCAVRTASRTWNETKGNM